MMNAWTTRLEEMGLAVRLHLLKRFSSQRKSLATPVAFESGDTIYKIDRCVEPIIIQAINNWPEECKPLVLVAEGIGKNGISRFGKSKMPPRFRVIVDPIDGTRALMYEKRSAWFLAAVAIDRGDATCLSDCFASVMVELPTPKQYLADSFFATQKGSAKGRRMSIDGKSVARLPIRPSRASSLLHGFGQVANFFPGTKEFASELMEKIVKHSLVGVEPGEASVFDDQYISTGGQMVELMLGHDRFCCDLRPLFHQIVFRKMGQGVRGIECHPYDIAGALVAVQAGVILTNGFGEPLDAHLNVTDGVHWCGYANSTIRSALEPAIHQWLDEHGVESTSSDNE